MSECPTCGRPLRAQDNFCSGCGAPVARSDRVSPESRTPSVGIARRLLTTYPLADRGWRVVAAIGALAVVFAAAAGLAASLMRAEPTASDEPPPVTPSVTKAPAAPPEERPLTIVEPMPAAPVAPGRTPALTATPAPTRSVSAIVELAGRPVSTASPAPPTPTAAAPQPTSPPEVPTPVPASPLADGAVRSEWVEDLIIAAVPDAELPALLAEHRNAVLGAPYPPGLPVWTAYRLTNLRPGQQIRREWVREQEIVAKTAIDWSDDLPTVWRASLAPHQMRGGRWNVRVWVDDQLAAAQPFEVEAGIMALRDVRFAIELLADGRPLTPIHSAPFRVPLVFATFSVFNAPADLVIDIRWVHNGEVVETASIDWPGTTGPGSWQPVALPLGTDDGPPLAAGDWRFVADIDGAEVLNDIFKIEAPA